MNRKEIRREIDKLARMVEGWDAFAEVPTLERDLALELLRHLYEAIRCCGETEVAVAAASESVSESAPEAALRTAPAEHTSVAAPADNPSMQEPQAPLPEREEDAEAFDTTEVLDLNELLSLGADSVMPAESVYTEPSAASDETSLPDRTESRMPEPVSASEPEAGEPVPASVGEIPEPAPDPVPIVVSGPTSEPTPEPASEPAPEPTSGPTSESAPEPAPDPVPIVVSGPTSAPTPEPASEPVPAPSPEPAPSEPESKPSSSSPTLFGLEEDTVRHRHKQRVIMSLYDTPAEPESPTREPASPRGFTSRNSDSSPMTFGVDQGARPGRPDSSAAQPRPGVPESDEPAVPHYAASEPHAAEPAVAPGAVLGDVINHDVQTLADTIAPPRDVASELRRQESVDDLRRAIGINDKFLLIRDLFDGDRLSYDRALDALNACESLDDCMIYIAEHYAWNPESDGARLLMELLERKFS